MKTIVIAIAILLVSILGWAFFGHPFQLAGTEVSVMKDRTDTLLKYPDSSEIFQLFGQSTWESKKFRAQSLSNYQQNTIYSSSLPDGVLLFSNPGIRNKEIAGFKQKVQSQIMSMNNEKVGLSKSSIYLPLVKELNRMANSTAKNKAVVLYSDCLENTPLFSIYVDSFRNQLTYYPDKTAKLFLQLAKPVNLTGIRVYILFRPKNDKESEDFQLMSRLFQKILTDAGAEVEVAANLITDNNKN